MAEENTERSGVPAEAASGTEATGVTDKPAQKVQRRPIRIKPKPKTGGSAKRLEFWKDGSETVLSVVKILTLLVVTTAVVLLIVAVVLRDRGQRQVTVEIDSKVEKLIFDLGIDFDLRATLRDETNSRIGGVKSFLEASLFKDVDIGGSQPVSFKPFGVDATTSDVTGLARLLPGGEPAFRVRLELLCEPGPCDAPRFGGRPIKERVQRLTLVVNVSGPDRNERLVFPMSAKPAALRRGLRLAMQQSAEKLLELAEPMVASVFYLNTLNTTGFAEEQRRYATLAAGATFLVRSETPDRNCMSDIVLGDSLMWRGDTESGVEMLEEIARESRQKRTKLASASSLDRARICVVQAKTDQIIFLFLRLCNNLAAEKPLKMVQDAIDDMEDLAKIVKGAPVPEQIRVKEFSAYLEFVKTLFANDAASLEATCKGGDAASPSSDIVSSRRKRAILALEVFRAALPPKTPLAGWETISRTLVSYLDVFPAAPPPKEALKTPALVLDILLSYIDIAIPPVAVVDRLNVLLDAMKIANEYARVNSAPGALYLRSGRVFRKIAVVARDARHRVADDVEKMRFVNRWRNKPEGTKLGVKEDVNKLLEGELTWSLAQARTAFEHASTAVNPFPWLESSPNMEAMIYLGDMYYADSSIDKPADKPVDKLADKPIDKSVDDAEKYYAAALRLFIEQDAPLREFKFMATAAARWAIIRVRAGACASPPAPGSRWDEVWVVLGAKENHDWCRIVDSGQQSATDKLGVLGIVGAYIRQTEEQCRQTGPFASSTRTDSAITTALRLDLIECLERVDAAVAREFFFNNSASNIDKKIGEALAARGPADPPAGSVAAQPDKAL